MKTFLVCLLFPLTAAAGNNQLTGNARMDLLTASLSDSLPQSKSVMVQSQDERSKLKRPLLGGAMSLLVPGAGEFYSDRFLKSAIFFAVEVPAITGAIAYNNKGNNQTTAFQNYANQHWSAVDYATWISLNGANYECPGQRIRRYPSTRIRLSLHGREWISLKSITGNRSPITRDFLMNCQRIIRSSIMN